MASALFTAGSPESEPHKTRPVLLTDFAYVERPCREVLQILLDPGSAWLYRLASVVGPKQPSFGTRRDEAEKQMAALIRLGRGPERLRPLAIMSIGIPRRTDSGAVVSLSWDPVSLGPLLPRIEADLVTSQLNRAVTRLELRASYRAPFSRIGEGLDRLAMHRATEAGMRAFLQDLTEVLRSSPERDE